MVDYGRGLTQTQIKEVWEASVLKRIVKAMGGKLECHASLYTTNFILTIPCKSV